MKYSVGLGGGAAEKNLVAHVDATVVFFRFFNGCKDGNTLGAWRAQLYNQKEQIDMFKLIIFNGSVFDGSCFIIISPLPKLSRVPYNLIRLGSEPVGEKQIERRTA